MDYPGGFITKTAPTLNPALGNAAPGVWRLNDVLKNIKAGTWPPYDPYFEYTTLLLHGNGTNGAQNNTFQDSSSNNFSITRNGDTTQGTFSPFSLTAGTWSNYFDGSGDYLTLPSNSAFAFGTGDFTAECWVYFASFVSANQALFDFRDGLDTTSLEMGVYSNNIPFLSNSSGGVLNGSFTFSVGTWYHIAFTRSGTSLNIWVNGTNVGSTSNSTNWTGNNCKIGGNPNGAENPNAYISNARVVKGTAVYTSAFTPPTAPLTAISGTSLLTCQNNRFIDNSSNAFTITVNGNTSVQAFSPFNPTAAYSAATVGGSGYFDGSGDVLSIADAAALELGSSDFCVEGWYYPLSFSANLVLVGKRANTTSTGAFIIYANSGSGALTFYASTNGSTYFWSGATVGTMVLNQWNHFAVYRSGNNWYGSINGVVSSMGSSSNSIYNDAESWRIGGDSNGNYANGYIASTRIVNGSAVYGASNFTPPTAPLTAITNTQLLLNFTNAGIIDNTAQNDMVTYASAQISTAQSKFGGGSILFNGTTDFIYGGLGQTWNFLTGPFTIECWVYFNSVASGYVFSNANSSGNLSNGMTLYFSSSGTLTLYGPSVSGTATTSVSTGQWYHLAVTRSGNTFYLFKDGVQQGTFTDSGSITGTDSSRYFGIGRSASYSAAGWLSAYIDEFRITKGIARYTSNFTPQTSQWQDQ